MAACPESLPELFHMGMATAWHAPVGERGVGGSRFVKKMVSISPVSGRTKQVWLFLSPFRRMKMGKKKWMG